MGEVSKVHYRVDPRLIHATLMSSWVPAVGARWILVSDARVLNDDRRRTIYEMAAGGALDVHFVAEPITAQKVLELEAGGPGIVLLSSLASVLRAMRGGLELDELNIGHIPEGPGREAFLPSVHLGSGDHEMLRQIEALSVSVYVQALPSDERVRPPAAVAAVAPSQISSSPDDSGVFPMPLPVPEPVVEEVREGFAKAAFEIVNERGLHLRAAHVLAALCNELPVEVRMGRGGNLINAKSLLGLTTLGAARGTFLDVEVEGEGAKDALERIRALFAAGFDEGAGAGG